MYRASHFAQRRPAHRAAAAYDIWPARESETENTAVLPHAPVRRRAPCEPFHEDETADDAEKEPYEAFGDDPWAAPAKDAHSTAAGGRLLLRRTSSGDAYEPFGAATGDSGGPALRRTTSSDAYEPFGDSFGDSFGDNPFGDNSFGDNSFGEPFLALRRQPSNSVYVYSAFGDDGTATGHGPMQEPPVKAKRAANLDAADGAAAEESTAAARAKWLAPPPRTLEWIRPPPRPPSVFEHPPRSSQVVSLGGSLAEQSPLRAFFANSQAHRRFLPDPKGIPRGEPRGGGDDSRRGDRSNRGGGGTSGVGGGGSGFEQPSLRHANSSGGSDPTPPLVVALRSDSSADKDCGGGDKDWNSAWQEALELPQRAKGGSRWERLAKLSADFKATAENYCRVIVMERHLLDDQKTVKPLRGAATGVAGGEKYLVAGMYVKFLIDHKQVYGSEEHAAKIGNHELRGANVIFSSSAALARRLASSSDEQPAPSSAAPRGNSGGGGSGPGGGSGGGDHGGGVGPIRVPLMVLVDFLGCRLLATAKLPVSPATLVFGTDDAGRTIARQGGNCEFRGEGSATGDGGGAAALMAAVAASMNLRPHQVFIGNPTRRWAACDYARGSLCPCASCV